MTPSCSTNRQVEVIFRSEGGNRLGLAIVPLCRGFDEHRRPLAPSKFFDDNGNNFS